MFQKSLRISILTICAIVMSMQFISIVTAKDNPLPAPTGSYKVGSLWKHWIDPTRDETFDKAPHGKREIMVEILYPAKPADGKQMAPYILNKETVIHAFVDFLTAVGIPAPWHVADFTDFQDYSYPNAPLADDTNYPVLIFSHGAATESTLYTAQLEELASHGYIVVAINHPYGAASTVSRTDAPSPLLSLLSTPTKMKTLL